MIRFYPYPDSQLPLVIEPRQPGGGLASLKAWLAEAETFYKDQLRQYGAVLFRGFAIDSPELFDQFLATLDGKLLDYVGGNSPRTKLQSGIYTSTEYPPEFFISLHNENSYGPQWPELLYFCCVTAPQSGGSTVIADGRKVLADLDPQVVAEFSAKQVRYLRKLHGGRGMGPSWQETFETDDALAVEAICREGQISYRWERGRTLHLSQIGPGILTHPTTGEQVWFNQADQFHPSKQGAEVYNSMKLLFGDNPERYPTFATFGDGSLIDESYFEHISQTFAKHTIAFPWQQGDVLVLDNLLIAHGRAAFEGPRKILVSMTRPLSFNPGPVSDPAQPTFSLGGFS